MYFEYLWAHSRANYSNSKSKEKENSRQCTACKMIISHLRKYARIVEMCNEHWPWENAIATIFRIDSCKIHGQQPWENALDNKECCATDTY
jgi:hypothetical protein